MTDQEREAIFFEIHTDNELEGPGNFAATQQAFARLTGLPDQPIILDAGCGPGRQTLDLARLSTGPITAVDLHSPFVEHLRQRAEERGLGDRITVVEGDMGNLQFPPQSCDVIWSEGAIYNIGFEHGLRIWKPLLKPGGYAAVSELSWLKPGAPSDVQAFWAEEYPAMRTVADNCAGMQQAGYQLIDYFTLPESAWWDYYGPIEERIRALREHYAGNPDALEVLAWEQREIENYRQYSDYYGYVFYLGRVAS